ncbi:putative ABC transport system ATP-binding protein [Haloactinospora alba]|uniref:Putative ABC transport system ATP-binding protein n=1 Tax=Haloactinospora alba TaxID=405555 RepID=A0A543N9A1_9ACTN|nr:ATP-binding cassette domain-containing protein [Haloactinospora alba]TQN28416.1 putative ABC transport system ATP-binding protein [Haloactinospora alba]
MITIESLSKSFGDRTLWSGLDLTIQDGEMLALTGPSGAGKSTLLNCLGLLEPADGGRILIDGQDILRFGMARRRRFRRDVLGYLFQSYALVENATVADNLDIATRVRRPLLSRHRPDYRKALERVGLEGRERETIHHLSGGEQQRVGLARLMVKEPALILADEPTGALDKDNADLVVEVLRDMSRAGCTVVLATHDDRVRDGCDTSVTIGSQSTVGTQATG